MDMMKNRIAPARFLRCFFLPLLFSLVSAAVNAAPPQYAFRVTFKDKTGAPTLSSSPPWLSARAMARRAAFNLPLDSTDRPVSPRYVDNMLALTGGKLHNTSRWLNQCVVLLTDSSKILTLSGKPWISSIAWVGYFPAGLHRAVGSNPKFALETADANGAIAQTNARLAGSSAYYGATWGQTAMVHGDTLHDQGFRGKGKLIAVLDEGFLDADTHPGFDSLRKSGRLLETYNFVRDTPSVYEGGTHGTSCLSDIAGVLPGTFVGTAPDAQYALYITEDGAFTDALYELDNLVAGMERADSIGADVISASLGYNTFVSPFTFTISKAELDGHTTNVSRAVNLAARKGILYVTSAGNEDGNGWNYLVAPADADSALTIGAVTPTRAPASFSSPGPSASGRIKPDVCLQGQPAAVLLGGGAVGTANGTSFACPQAAGWAACLLQAFPTLPPSIIRTAIDSSADQRPPTPKLGFGIPDFRKAQQFLGKLILPPAAGAFLVMPNPFFGSISVTLPDAASVAELHLYDVVGREVGFIQSRSGATVNMDIPRLSFPGGVYVLRAVVDGQRYVQKLLHY